MLLNIFCIVIAYCVGSLSSAIIVCRLWGLPDPRSKGSNNPGATNVLRIGGKLPAFITLLGDGCKGFLPTFMVTYMDLANWVIGAVMLAALVGHVLPVFFAFKGGKGVATAMGAFLGLSWQLGAILIILWGSVIALSRISSLGAIVAAITAPSVAYVLLQDSSLTIAISVMSLILLIRHKGNIVRLFKGKEGKI